MENQIRRVEIEPEGAAFVPLSMRARVFPGAFGVARMGLLASLGIAIAAAAVESKDRGLGSMGFGMAVAWLSGRSIGKDSVREALTGVNPQAEARAFGGGASRAVLEMTGPAGPED